MRLAESLENFSSNILYILVTAQGRRPHHHLHCSISGKISSLFYLSDKISELCRNSWIFHCNILDILVSAQGLLSSHHLHCSTSGQISSLFYLSDKISELELGRIAGIFCSSSWTPQLEAQLLHTPVCSAHCVAGWGWGGAKVCMKYACAHLVHTVCKQHAYSMHTLECISILFEADRILEI